MKKINTIDFQFCRRSTVLADNRVVALMAVVAVRFAHINIYLSTLRIRTKKWIAE